MKTKKLSLSAFISSILIFSVLLTGFRTPVFAQRPRPIVITFGQPNIWSLEQAHYLLARMHRQNLDLQTAPLGSLDPNAANASRIDILKTLLQAGVSFDQAVGLNNELLKQDKIFNSDRRRQLLNNRSTLQAESTQLARDIASLKTAKARATTEVERTEIQNSLDAKTEQKAAVDNELTQTNDEAQGLTSATGEFQSATVPEFSTSTITGDLDALIDKVQLINPAIAATLRLDNHIQLQYEVISKQLTLLRDEVGPGERLVFLELPQSINATQDRAENKMAQTWWRIAGYTTVDKDMVFRLELRRLFTDIERIKQELSVATSLRNQNNSNRTNLQQDVDQLSAEKARVVAEIAKLKDEQDPIDKRKKELEERVQAAKKSQEAAQAELNEAIKSRNLRRTRGEARRLARAQRNVESAQEDAKEYTLGQASRYQEITKEINDRRTSQETLEKTISGKRLEIQRIDYDYTRLLKAYTSLSTKAERLKLEIVKKDIRAKQDEVERLLQGAGADTYEVVEEVMNLLHGQHDLEKANYAPSAKPKTSRSFSQESVRQKCDQVIHAQTTRDLAAASNCDPRTFINLEETNPLNSSAIKDKDKPEFKSEIRKRAVRTIDIIPRQNAINVQDTKQRVARTGIFAAVSFLFGFAGKFTYERQREQAEQFLNQELFTSGFGKGEKDFGWSFYPFAGTKQLASGVRTTYAVAIIPDNAETLVGSSA
jgi:archaellum component FlaC